MTLNINEFVQERKDRTENCGGGWLAYISKNLEYKRKLDLEMSNIETMLFEIKPCHKRSFLLCIVYKGNNKITELRTILQRESQTHKYINRKNQSTTGKL
jgi:hypothetical protein